MDTHYRPFFPAGNLPKGVATHAGLFTGLCVPSIAALKRRCDQMSSAECMFWTLGPKQVGKATISGWQDMLAPAIAELGDGLALWPFNGNLDSLIRAGRIVVLETYPGGMYSHFGIAGNNKRSQAWRRNTATDLKAWAQGADVEVDELLLARIDDGFGASDVAEDEFDAVVGLFGMLNVLLGRRPEGAPVGDDVRKVEGWMLGLQE